MTIILFFQGDSGGPLTFKQNGQHVLIGDVSRGQSDSARVGQRSEVTSQSQSTIFLSDVQDRIIYFSPGKMDCMGGYLTSESGLKDK